MSCAATILRGDISLPLPQEVSAFSLFHKPEKLRGLCAELQTVSSTRLTARGLPNSSRRMDMKGKAVLMGFVGKC